LASLALEERATTDLRAALAGIHQRLSEVHLRQGNSDPAETAALKAVGFAEAYSVDHAEDSEAAINLAAAYYAHAERLAARGDFAHALSRIAEARSIQEKLRSDQPLNTRYLFALAFTLNAQGQYYQSANELPAAVRTFEQGRVIADELAAADARDRLGLLAQGVARRSLGWAQVVAGDRTTGIVWLREARRLVETVSREDPGNGFARDELAGIDYYLGKALLRSSSRHDLVEGCAALQRTLVAWESARAAGTLYAAASSSLPEVQTLTARCTPGVP
jgi:tetratricopeptide (TPR) repeat protein